MIGAPSTQWWVHLSTAIVFGLGFATVLTLVVTPATLMLLARMSAWRLSRRHARAVRRRRRMAKAARKPSRLLPELVPEPAE
jgi:multidrug efflux pump